MWRRLLGGRETKNSPGHQYLISALGWRGKPHQVFRMCIAGDIELVLSPPILEELEQVMEYSKFDFSEQVKNEFLSELITCARLVLPVQKVEVISADPEDNKFLECAVAADADYIVSGDHHLLKLGEYGGIRIVKASEFLETEFPNRER